MNPTSKYGPNAGQHPATGQNYTIRATVEFFEYGLNSRSRRQRNGADGYGHR